MVKEILSFGPLCVAPEYQRQKLGKFRIEHSFDVARKMGYDVNIIITVKETALLIPKTIMWLQVVRPS